MLPPEYREGLCAGGGTGVFWLTAYYGRLVAYLPEDLDSLEYVPYGMETTVLNFKNRKVNAERKAAARAAKAARAKGSEG